MQEKLKLNLIPLLAIYFFLLFTLVYSGSANVYNSFALLYILCCSYIIGSAIFPRSLNETFLPATHGLLSILTGALIFSLFIFVTIVPLYLFVIFGVAAILALFVKRKEILFSYKINWFELSAVILSVLLMFVISGWQVNEEFSAFQIGNQDYSSDHFVFTSFVSSFRHGSVNAVYETGTPVIYQDLGFFIPSMLAALLKISSYQALWGLAQPFYKIVAILLGYDLFFLFFKDKVGKGNYLFMIAAICFPLLIAPLHPLYVAKLNVSNFIFSGIGYLLPNGTVTFPISMVLELTCLIVFSSCDWKSKADVRKKVFFSVLLGLICIAKMMMYVDFAIFMVVIILYRIVIRKERMLSYLPYAVISLVAAGVVYKLCFGYPTLTKVYFKYGVLTEYFGTLFKRSSVGFANNVIIILLMVGMYMVWLGIRLVGLWGLLKSKASIFSDFFIGSLLALAICTVLALFVHMEYLDINGRVARDATPDVQQLLRSSFYVVSIVSMIGLFYLIINSEKKIVRNIVAAMAAVWCLLAFICLFPKKLYPPFAATQWRSSAWYTENLTLLKSGRLDDGLIVVNPGIGTFGSMLCGSDYGKYWTAMGAGEGCYNPAAKNAYRWDIYAKLLAQPNEALLDRMKSEGVKYVVGTPYDFVQVSHLVAMFPQRLKKVDNSAWVYELQ